MQTFFRPVSDEVLHGLQYVCLGVAGGFVLRFIHEIFQLFHVDFIKVQAVINNCMSNFRIFQNEMVYSVQLLAIADLGLDEL